MASAKPLVIVGVLLEIFIIVLYGIFVRFDELARMEDQSSEKNAEALSLFTVRYPLMQHVHVMIFVGFGFLMTFLKHHSWSGVSINYLTAAGAMQIYILFMGFWEAVEEDNWSDTININVSILIRADYCAAAVLISFGAVIGKINAAQMLLMMVIEVFIYALQEMIVFLKIEAIDAGGSITIHTYGAYFGLMFSLIYSPRTAVGNPYNESHYNSSLFAMIGTIFLWMFWPSFNTAIVEDPAGMHRAVINTFLSLTGSCISTFITSAIFNEGKFHMEDILNASLAGGVVIGSACDVIVYPFISVLCGFLGGVISTVGFKRMSKFLEDRIGLFDTAGINNLHGMPGLLGGILSAIIIPGLEVTRWNINPEEYGFDDFNEQGEKQLAATFTSLGFSLVGGLIAGIVVKYTPLNQTLSFFEDKPYWIKCEPDPYEKLSMSNNPFDVPVQKDSHIGYSAVDASSPITYNSPKKYQDDNI